MHTMSRIAASLFCHEADRLCVNGHQSECEQVTTTRWIYFLSITVLLVHCPTLHHINTQTYQRSPAYADIPKMTVHSIWVINKAGGLVFSRSYSGMSRPSTTSPRLILQTYFPHSLWIQS